MLDNIIKLTPLSGALLIFSGILKLIFFYSYFGIPITDYLEFQEIITSFLGDMNIVIVFGMTMILISFITLNFLGKKTKLPHNELIEKILILTYPRRFKYFFSFLVPIIVLSILLYFRILYCHYVIIYLLIFASIQMLTYIFLHKRENGEIEIPSFYGLLLLGTSLTISLFLLSFHDIQAVENSNSKVTIYLDNGVIDLNPQTKNLFIGKTSKFVFVKLDSLKSTVIIPVERINQFKFE